MILVVRSMGTGVLVSSWQRGYSVVLHSLHLRHAPCAELAAALASRISGGRNNAGTVHVGINLYATPGPGAQGLVQHYDDHGVFVCVLSLRALQPRAIGCSTAAAVLHACIEPTPRFAAAI